MGGSHRVVIEPGASLPDHDWRWEQANLPDTWPYLGPAWLRGNDKALAEARPWHTVARRGRGELAWLPGLVFERAPSVDWDPRTYLGWQPPTGEQVCCGVQRCDQTVDEVGALGEEPFFPALLLGSALGYRSEIAFTFWTPALFPSMVEQAVRAALADGIRSVVAPWIPDRRGNDGIISALRAEGGHTCFWGYEDYLELTAVNYDEHLASLSAKKRRRVKEDLANLTASNVTISRVTSQDLRPLVPRIAELTCMNREKNGAGEQPHHISAIFDVLLDAGADVRCHLATKDGEIVASCVTIRKANRLFIKWVGFDYGRLGDRSGVYFPLVFDAPLREAYAEGLRFVECGAGAHRAKALRGCQPRVLSSALLVADPTLRKRVAGWLTTFGQRREAAFALDQPEQGVATACGSGKE